MIASDIHGSAFYCKQLIEAYKQEQPDKLLLLGDLLYHGPRNDLPKDYAPKQVIEMLNAISDQLICVRGKLRSRSRPDGTKLPCPKRILHPIHRWTNHLRNPRAHKLSSKSSKIT